jgi:hypothetical protein
VGTGLATREAHRPVFAHPIRAALPLNTSILRAGFFLALIGIAVPGPAVSAQERPESGVWWTASAAAHASRLTCDLCEPGRDLGSALGLGIGTYAAPNLRIGMDLGYATGTDDGVRESVLSAGLVAEIHPLERRGLHLIGGLGWAGYRAEDFAYDGVRLRLGLGWDLRLADTWVVGNRLTYDASSFGSLKNEGEPVVRGVGLGTLQFGLYVGRR